MAHSDIVLDFNNMMADLLGPSGLTRKGIEQVQVRQIQKGLTDLRRLGQLPFMDLPHQEVLEIEREAARIRDQFEAVLVLGIGGSALGARFLLQALGSDGPKLVVCDSVDPWEWDQLRDELDFKKTAVMAVSKSGKTIETLAALTFFLDLLKKAAGPDWKRRLILITDPKEGEFRRVATGEQIVSFAIPPGVGGRYSVLTPAGLLPAACAGVPIGELLSGARRMDERCCNDDLWTNPALMSAVLHYLFDREKGRRIRVILPYGERLKGYGPWFAQLWAESLGKRRSLKGKEVLAGTTPIVGSGPQDQHSQLQLYLEGPEDKTVTFLDVEKPRKDLNLPTGAPFSYGDLSLGGRSVHELQRIEKASTEEALREVGRPNQTILLRDLTPSIIGQLIFMAEMETVYAGELYNVNPFDQPAVEAIKRNIRQRLSGKISPQKDRTYTI